MIKKITKILAIALALAMLAHIIPAYAANPNEKCKITVNGQNAEWKLRPFLAYGPHGDAKIMIPMRDLFTTLGYAVTYDPKANRSVFTASKNSEYASFYVDLKTGQAVKDGEKAPKREADYVYFVNDSLYVAARDYFGLDAMAKLYLNDSAVKISYDYIYTPNEDFITDYSHYFTIKSNISSLRVEINGKGTDHPYIGEQYTKYNTGDWVSGAEVKSKFHDITLEGLWDGFDSLCFYTGKGEKNELTGKNSKAYAISWKLMDAVAEEINKLRKKEGLQELKIDHSLCFVSVGAGDSKVDSVFDNSIHNFENRTATHTYCGKTIKAECWAAIFLHGGQDPVTKKYDSSTAEIAKNIAKRWYDSYKGHKEIILNKKYDTIGILVIIGDAGITTSSHAYAVFK